MGKKRGGKVPASKYEVAEGGLKVIKTDYLLRRNLIIPA
jgi:hypothetical protein